MVLKNRLKNKIVLASILVFAFVGLSCIVVFAAGRLAFHHGHHISQGIECVDCHTTIAKDKGVKRVLPKKHSCDECHTKTDTFDCKTCEENPWRKKERCEEHRDFNFLHSDHSKTLGTCTACHGDLDKKPHKPGDHKTCGKCHEKDIKGLLCAKCHRDFAKAGLNEMSRFKHENDFLKEHASYAGRSMRTCTQCHTQMFCTDCHSKKWTGQKPSIRYPEAVKRNFIHRGDWITFHRVEARTGDLTCLKCHARKDCNSCHNRANVAASSGKNIYKHPAGWLNKVGSHFHGDEARKNIISCASCHEKKGPGYCVDCHKASRGLNPHPKGFGKVRNLDKKNRMCASCHDK